MITSWIWARALVLLAAVIPASTTLGATVKFVEAFEEGDANWATTEGLMGLDYVASGGADGGGYISDALDFALLEDSESLVVFRATAAQGASGGALAGNWIADGVQEFSAQVRHNGPVPLNFFTRFAAAPRNFPGAFALQFTPVPPNTWTELSFAITPDNPAFVTFEGASFADVFENLGNVQIGVDVPAGLGGSQTPITFDLDQVAVTVPEPSTVVLLAAVPLLLGFLGRRRAQRTA